MTQPNYLTEVRDQYENFPYPPVDPQDELKRLLITKTEELDRLNHYGFGGKRDFTKPFRVLVAGGGTGSAAIALAEQLRGHPAEIIYLDMSQTSMAIAKERAALRTLENITWIHDSLLNIPKLNLGPFDYINCSGVLHHLSDPDAGLKILSDALSETGVLGVMVYAKYGRMAVYQMQETLRLLNNHEPDMEKRVSNARAVLAELPASNWFFRSPPLIVNEVKTDIGTYDLLLHSQDRAYSVPEFYRFLESAKLCLLHFVSEENRYGNRLYDPATYLKTEHLVAEAKRLPLSEQQALAELLNGQICMHIAYAAKTPIAQPDFADLDLIPAFSAVFKPALDMIVNTLRQPGDQFTFALSNDVPLVLNRTPNLVAFLKRIDGKTPLRQIYRKIMDTASNSKPNYQTLTEEFSPLYATLRAHDFFYLRAPSGYDYPTIEAMQSRIAGRIPV